jgi:hypothetical protein
MKTGIFLTVFSVLLALGCKTTVVEQESGLYIACLDDGTTCAVYRAGYAGGMSCDWQGPKTCKIVNKKPERS